MSSLLGEKGIKRLIKTMDNPMTSTQTQEDVASITTTIVRDATAGTQTREIPTLRLKLRKPKSRKKVEWVTGTVDNEDMNKKKSKSCCIYKKPREFGESSSSSDDSDDEHEHHKGNAEKRQGTTQNGSPSTSGADGVTTAGTSTETETNSLPLPDEQFKSS